MAARLGLIIVPLIALPLAGAPSIEYRMPVDPVPSADFDRLIADSLEKWEVPGAAVAIVSRDRILCLKGCGRRELGGDRPVTPDTVFPLASCTKAFTTTLLAMLADDGKLGWDDPMRQRWPEFHLSDPLADTAVTLRDLLTHRTGVASHDFLWYRSPLPQAELVRRVGRLPLERSFRSAFQYQSVMYTAAGLAAGRAGGSTWPDLVQKRILAPLAMNSARVTTPTTEQAPDLASPHRPDRDGKLRQIAWYVQAEPNPAGSIHASARDLVPWLQFHIGDGTWNGQRLVSAANLHETHTPQFALRIEGLVKAANPDTLLMSYGLGWVIQDYRGHLLISHAGTIDGFRAHITLLPRPGFALAILSNRHHTRMNLALSNVLVDRLLNLPPKDWHAHFRELVQSEMRIVDAARQKRADERRPGTKPSRPLADYGGAYEHPAYGQARVTERAGRLWWEWSGFRGPLDHYHDDTFTLVNDDLNDPLIPFVVALAGEVEAFSFVNLPFRRVKKSN